jgi:hypothetical protein
MKIWGNDLMVEYFDVKFLTISNKEIENLNIY